MKNPTVRLLLATGLAIGAGHSHAVTYTLTLTQNGAVQPQSFVSNGFAYTQNYVYFTPQIPNITLVGGDILDLTVNLTTALVVPPGSSGSSINLQIPATASSTGSNPTIGFFTETYSLYSGATLLPNPFGGISGSGLPLILGGSTSTARTTAFSFDRAVFRVVMQSGSSFVFTPGSTAYIYSQGISPVPEPATLSMLLLGFACVGGAARLSARKRSAGRHV